MNNLKNLENMKHSYVRATLNQETNTIRMISARAMAAAATARRVAMTLLLATFTAATAWADSSFGGGSGTLQDPYLIGTPQHLRQLAADVNDGNDYEGKYFKMTQSFSLWIEPFTPIGGKYYTEGSGKDQSTGTRKFCGTFDGNRYEISDLQIHESDEFYAIGLFGELGYGAVVKNLTIGRFESKVNSVIMGWGNCGAIAGSVSSGAGIYDCHVESDITVSVDPDNLAQNVENNKDFGGIVGENLGIISGCTSRATVTNAGCQGVNRLGGIVGYNGGSVSSCISLATVVGSNQVGAIAGNCGDNYAFSKSYYHNEDIPGAVNGANISGATWMGTLSYSEWIAGGSANSATVYNDNGTLYYGADTKMWMTLTLNEHPDGWVVNNIENVQFTANGTVLTDDRMGGVDYKVFYMPTEDVTITATGMDCQRDIAYSPWVMIEILEQEYTGEPLTPAITVTDVKDGAQTLLQEGVDYAVSLPETPMVNEGDYTITITGMGDYAGATTATFTIDPAGASSEWQGSGTEEDPYRILSVNAMSRVAERIGEMDYTDVYFVLGANLDYTGKVYKVIGSSSNPFKGHFDGKGHTLSNVSLVKEENRVGLFGVIDANGEVKNLTLGSGSQIKGRDYVAAIAGRNNGRIENCVNYAAVTGLTYEEEDDGTIEVYGSSVIAGIAGINSGDVINCRNYGNINARKQAAGIVGSVLSGNVEKCVNEGSVSSQTGMAGGIVAYLYRGTVSSCLNLGQVSGSSDAGGIIGYNNGVESHFNNYYSGECTVGGINNNDVAGKAEKAYAVAATPANIVTRMEVCGDLTLYANGMFYGGKYYVPSVGLYDAASNDALISEMATYSSKSFSVTLCGRTLYKDGKWNTLCLPFDVTVGSDVMASATAMTLNGETSGFNSTTGELTLNFTNVADGSTIAAGTPFIAKWTGSNVTDPVFSGVTVRSTTAGSVTSTDGYVTFVGTFSPKNIGEGGDNTILYLGSGNKLYWPSSAKDINSFRAYFQLNNGLTAGIPDPSGDGSGSGVRAFNLNFGDDDATGIFSATLNDKGQMINDKWYSLDGRKLSGKPTKKGLYINNGKKVVIK